MTTTLLHRTSPLSVHLGDGDTILVELPDGREILYPRQALAIIDAFAEPMTLAAAERALAAYGDIAATIRQLVAEGVLVTEANQPGLPVSGYQDPSVHIEMLADRERTLAFIEVIRATVGPDDIVVDVGTGSGLLAIAAAQAGARHVYAVEATDIDAVAQRTFEANGVQDRITLLRGLSTEIELPERATVLVSEMIGNDALEERVLEVTLDARERLLTPDARLIPRGVGVGVILVELPADIRRAFALEAATVQTWALDYGIDFAPLREAAVGVERSATSASTRTAAAWLPFAQAPDLVTIDLATFHDARAEGRATVRVDHDGTIDAALAYWDLELGAGQTITTEPAHAGGTHWRTPVWCLFEPLRVEAGDEVEITYRYRVPGEGDGASVRRLP